MLFLCSRIRDEELALYTDTGYWYKMDGELKPKLKARLNRVSGQVAGVQRMVEEDRYCVDVMAQIAAARAALAKVSKLLLESHIQTCVSQAFESDDPADRATKIAELISVFDKNCS